MPTSRRPFTFLVSTLTLLLMVSAGIPVGSEPAPDRLYVVISPLDGPGSSGVVAFDVDPEGRLTQGSTYATGGTGSAIKSPQLAVVDPAKDLLFVPNNESDDVSVLAIGPGGSLSPVAGSPFLAVDSPGDLVLHPSGDWLYVNNFFIGVISVHSVSESGRLTLLQTVSAGFTHRMEIHPDGGYLYVADFISGVRGFAIGADGTLVELGSSPFAYTSSRPTDIEIDSRGRHLYVLDLDEGLAVFDIAATGELVTAVDPPVFISDFSSAFVLSDNDAHVYASEGFEDAIHAFKVRGNGRPRGLNRSPFVGDFTIFQMLNPSGTSMLYTVGVDTHRIGALGIAPNGRLSAPEFFNVVDEDGRAPVGAVFFGDSSPTVGTPSPERGYSPNSSR
jgi:6-phosphogluconolactonase (cycloisomerase 2 family)